MASLFHTWIFWFLVGLVIVHLLCKQSLKKDEARKKQQRILWEHGIFGVDVTKDLKMQGAPFFKCCSEVYNKALDIIFMDGHTTITIDGVQYNFQRNIKAFEIYEKITQKRFSLNNIHDYYILMYCLLVVNNPGMSLRIDEFLTIVEEIEKDEISSSSSGSKNKKKGKKENRKRHVPSIIEERTYNLIQNWSEKKVETDSTD